MTSGVKSRELSLRGRAVAADCAIVAYVDAAVGERRVRPPDGRAAGDRRLLDDPRPVDLLAAPRREPGDDQIAEFVGEEEAVSLPRADGGQIESCRNRKLR